MDRFPIKSWPRFICSNKSLRIDLTRKSPTSKCFQKFWMKKLRPIWFGDLVGSSPNLLHNKPITLVWRFRDHLNPKRIATKVKGLRGTRPAKVRSKAFPGRTGSLNPRKVCPPPARVSVSPCLDRKITATFPRKFTLALRANPGIIKESKCISISIF
jgi:hypothetical protein